MASNLNLHRICFRRNAGGRYQRAYLKWKSLHRGAWLLFSAPKKGSKNKLPNSLNIIEKLAEVFGLHMARMQSIYLLNSISQRIYIYIPQSTAATKKYNFPHYRH